jgi:hypothetical protein
MSGDTCIPFSHYQFIWLTSWTSLISSLYGYWKGLTYDLYMIPGSVFVTSMIYWSYPVEKSWREYLDVSVVRICAVLITYRAFYAEYVILQQVLMWFGISWFYYGLNFYRSNRIDEYTLCHMLLHIFGNLSNAALFSGYVEPICSPNSLLCG